MSSEGDNTIEVCGPGCACSECQLRARVAQLEAMLDDVARGSTHELVRYLLEKLVAAEKRAKASAAAEVAEPNRTLEDYDILQGLSDPMLRQLSHHPYIALASWCQHELVCRKRGPA